MYSRLTPSGLSVSVFAAKAVAVLVVVAAIAGMVRGYGGGSSSESTRNYYVAPVNTPPPVIQPQPTTPTVVAEVNNLTGLVPAAPPHRPQMILPANGSSLSSPSGKAPSTPPPAPDRVVVPVVINRDPPPVIYEQPRGVYPMGHEADLSPRTAGRPRGRSAEYKS